MRGVEPQCMARISPRHGNSKCPFVGKVTVDLEDGYPVKRLHLCIPHSRVLEHRGHLGTRADLLLRWLG